MGIGMSPLSHEIYRFFLALPVLSLTKGSICVPRDGLNQNCEKLTVLRVRSQVCRKLSTERGNCGRGSVPGPVRKGDAMSLSSFYPAAPAGTIHVPDLRPVADAAASRRQTEIGLPAPPALATAFPPISPPSAVGSGEVGRSLLAAVSAGEDVSAGKGEGERRLKPWGTAMLPDEATKAAVPHSEDSAGDMVDLRPALLESATAALGTEKPGRAAPTPDSVRQPPDIGRSGTAEKTEDGAGLRELPG
jgi:hypothetical protein